MTDSPAARLRAMLAAAAAPGLTVALAEGESVIKYKSPLNVVTYTYDHICY